MKVISFDALYELDFSVRVVNAMRQFWPKTKTYSCLGAPKKSNMLLFLDGVSAFYTLKGGKTLSAQSGSLILIPRGSEYRVEFSDFERADSNTVGINFFLSDEEGEVIPGEEILIFSDTNALSLVDKIRLSDEALRPCPALIKSAFYALLSLLWQKKRIVAQKFRCIEKGISYLENDPAGEKSIAEIASLCHVSQIYFRKLFTEYAGKSPAQFRMDLRIEKAKSLLSFEDADVSEIAFRLGFTDASYFCKQFKRHTGKTPLQYRRKRDC